jgi:protein-tyrosine phosphatase
LHRQLLSKSFAEELFNHRAAHDGLSWVALSRALAIERGNNVGALSPFTLKALEERGLAAQGGHRFATAYRTAR